MQQRGRLQDAQSSGRQPEAWRQRRRVRNERHRHSHGRAAGGHMHVRPLGDRPSPRNVARDCPEYHPEAKFLRIIQEKSGQKCAGHIRHLPEPKATADYRGRAFGHAMSARNPRHDHVLGGAVADVPQRRIPSRGLKFLIPAVESFFFQVIVNGLLAVDTFFFLSGLLLAMNVIRNLDKKNAKKQTIGMFLYRYLRLTPGCLVLLCFFTLVPLLGSGPIWKEKILPEVAACRRNWWAVLLNVNNFVHSERMCLPSLWYVSADWQLHCALFLIVFLLMRRPAFGGIAAFAAVIIFGVIIGVQTTLSGYPPTMLPLYAERSQVMAMVQDVVMRPYTHAGPFTVGLCTAFLIFKYPTTRITKVVQATLWLSSSLCMALSLFATWKWNRNVEASDLETLLYSSLHRTGWALGLGWTVYACLTDRCALVNKVLSWKAWLPLSRLTYGVYLAHPVVLDFQMWTIRERIFGSHMSMLYLFSGNLAVSMGVAVIFYLAFEAPFRKLCKDFIEKLLGCSLRAAPPASTVSRANSTRGGSSIRKQQQRRRNTATANSALDMPVSNGDVPQEKIGVASVHL
ncbi:nose resistant to fluoxetine protein 6-like isoform X5 [Dermacentor albipictus]|uniref:nose resistant to fluoxetine protein 6-like isoform X5 n=1 Tax=Dermacentor albipictus TaxID=60249 RepID=UPI0038FCDF6C